MSWLPNDPGVLDYASLPFKALGAPWGAIQTGVATGDWGKAGQALIDPDSAVRGRQLLEHLGLATPQSGMGADIGGAAVDMADPLQWLVLGGLGKAYSAMRGAGTAAKVADATEFLSPAQRLAGQQAEAGGGAIGGIRPMWEDDKAATGRVMDRMREMEQRAGMNPPTPPTPGIPNASTLYSFGAPMAGAAIEGENERSQNPSDAARILATTLMFSPLALGAAHMLRGKKAAPPDGTRNPQPSAPPTPPVQLPDQRAPAGLPIYSRMNQAVENLPENVKATSLANLLKKAQGSISQEEGDWTLPWTMHEDAQGQVTKAQNAVNAIREQMAANPLAAAPQAMPPAKVPWGGTPPPPPKEKTFAEILANAESVLLTAKARQAFLEQRGGNAPGGVVSRDQVRGIVHHNGIAIERRTMGGQSMEGSLAKAAREKYLAAEDALQQHPNSPNAQMAAEIQAAANNRFLAGGPHETDIDNPYRAIANTERSSLQQDRDAAYAEMNKLAGHSDEWVKAKQELDEANQAHEAALDTYRLLAGFKMKQYGYGTFAVEGPTGITYRQSPTRRGAVENAINISLPRLDDFNAIAERQLNAERAFSAAEGTEQANRPRFSTYATPGGQNYMERLLKLPQKQMSISEAFKQWMADAKAGKRGRYTPDELASMTPGDMEYILRQDYINPADKTFTHPHWPGDPNVLAHWRADDRVGPKGEKVLHVQEVQSDWHQTGREQGYKGNQKAIEAEHDSLASERSSLEKKYPYITDYAPEHDRPYTKDENQAIDRITAIHDRMNQIERMLSSPVPDAPFKNNEWANLALKDIMDHALKNGYDAISFNNGRLAKQYAAGGGGDLKGLTDWYERQLPERMKKLFGLEQEPHRIQANDARVFAGSHTIPFFRLKGKLGPNSYKLQGKLDQLQRSGIPMMSVLTALGLGGAASGYAGGQNAQGS